MARIKVLLVDDEREFVAALARRLRKRNLDIEIAADGEQALWQVQEHFPDVVVVDLNMPGIEATELVRRIKAVHPRVHVVVLTGEPWGDKVKDVLRVGAAGYLEKPLDINKLMEIIHRVELADRVPCPE
ncbi:MAG: response regulator [Desulfomonilaceae bacterium]|nr:response regulator [Desulfomonilaceae bacterium]